MNRSKFYKPVTGVFIQKEKERNGEDNFPWMLS